MAKRSTGTPEVEAYLAAVPEPFHAALQDLRRTLLAAAPEATETISYGMPAIALGGHALVSYAAFKRHCSLFPMSVATIDTLAKELAPFRTTKGTLQFTPEQPIPKAVVRKLVKARIAENAARYVKKPKAPKKAVGRTQRRT